MKIIFFILNFSLFINWNVFASNKNYCDDSCKLAYYKEILLSNGKHSYFLVVKVKANNTIKSLFIRNDCLYEYHKTMFKNDMIAYSDYIIKFIINDSVLPIKIDSLKKCIFLILEQSSEIYQINKTKGIAEAKKYFLKKSDEYRKKNIMFLQGIDIFFKNLYFINIGDESSSIFFEKFNCKQ